MSVTRLDVDRSPHVCHLYRGFDERKQIILPFIREGLEFGEFCLFVTSEESVFEWCLELQAYGVDVQQERQRGALDIMSGKDWRKPGRPNSITMAREAWTLVESKLADFTGVRIAGDAEWELDPATPVEDLCHWEATADHLFVSPKVRTICQYDLNSYSPAMIHAALRTHPVIFYRGRDRANPFHEASRILECEPALNGCSSDARLVADMLARLS